jgi:hypothetical protein
MGRMKEEGDACLEPQGLFPLNVPVLCEGSRPPLCYLNILNIIALPTQGRPPCLSSEDLRGASEGSSMGAWTKGIDAG